MARVAAFIPDLLFGSNVLGALRTGGHEAVLIDDPATIEADTVDVLVVDLTVDPQERIARVIAAERLAATPKLAFYSHVEADVRTLARDAGFELVVPRSRMAREGPTLVTSLAA